MSTSALGVFDIDSKYLKDVVVAQEERLRLGTAKPTVEVGPQAHALTKHLTNFPVRSQLLWLSSSRGCLVADIDCRRLSSA